MWNSLVRRYDLIYEYSNGVPRLVNLACDNALLVGYSSDTLLIDSGIVRRAISQMLPNFEDSTTDITSSGIEAEHDSEQELEDGRRL